MITVNAVGKACPEPVIMTRAAVEKGAAELEVLVDNAVAVSNVTRFLEDKLSTLGLSEREAAEFITFWGPRIAERGKALVTFASEEFARQAVYRLTDPSSGAGIVPDTFIRVYIVVGDVPQTAVPEQKLEPGPTRTGFTVVEWGGTER